MTTYLLSEPATVHVGVADHHRVHGHGTLGKCVGLVGDLPPADQRLVRISMDSLPLEFGPREVNELVNFLAGEGSGLSNSDIDEIPEPHR